MDSTELMFDNTQIKTIVEWWAERLKSPTFDNGDRSQTGAMVTMLMNMNAGAHIPADLQLDIFKNALASRLRQYKKMEGRNGLFVDYHPEGDLKACAEIAQIDESRFPIKTSMWFERERVTAKVGYGGAPIEILFSLV